MCVRDGAAGIAWRGGLTMLLVRRSRGGDFLLTGACAVFDEERGFWDGTAWKCRTFGGSGVEFDFDAREELRNARLKIYDRIFVGW